MRLHAARTPTFSHQPSTRPTPLQLVTREHDPVLAPELVDLLAPEPGQTAVDCTFGAGGHARLIAERLGPEGTLIGIDRDPTAQERFNRFAAEADLASLPAHVPELLRYARVLDAHLEGRIWVACARLTIADFQLASMATYWRQSDMPFETFPNIVRWLDGLTRVPAWADPWPNAELPA